MLQALKKLHTYRHRRIETASLPTAIINSMDKICFTADTHWYHANIIKYCQRPFSSVEEMNEFMVCLWNKYVFKNTRVYHLGDFCLGPAVKALEILERLSGKIYLCIGSHDKRLKTYHAASRMSARAIS